MKFLEKTVLEKPIPGYIKSKYEFIEVERIKPNASQPRKYFDSQKLAELAESLIQNGLLQPISVKKTSDGYELVAGERRLRAAKLADIKKIPCIIVEVDERKSGILALVENLQRENLNFFEEAEGVSALIEKHKMTQSQAAKILGKAQPTIANKLRLLELSDAHRERIILSGLTERHARSLLNLPPQLRESALSHVIEQNYNVAQTEYFVSQILKNKAGDPPKKPHIKGALRDLRMFDNTVKKAADALVQCGIKPLISKKTVGEYIEYTIKIKI